MLSRKISILILTFILISLWCHLLNFQGIPVPVIDILLFKLFTSSKTYHTIFSTFWTILTYKPLHTHMIFYTIECVTLGALNATNTFPVAWLPSTHPDYNLYCVKWTVVWFVRVFCPIGALLGCFGHDGEWHGLVGPFDILFLLFDAGILLCTIGIHFDPTFEVQLEIQSLKASHQDKKTEK